MTQFRAFAPARDFGEPDIPEVFDEEVEDDRLSPDEVAALIDNATAQARREGHAEGFAEGQAAERTGIATSLEEKATTLLNEVSALRAKEDELFEDLETRTSRLMLALVHQLARRLSEAEAMRLAENVTMRAVEAVRGKHRITIRASQELMDPLRQVLRLPTDEDASAHRIVFEPASEDASTPLEVAWLTGKVTFDPYAFTGAIDDVFNDTLENLMSGPAESLREGDEQ